MDSSAINEISRLAIEATKANVLNTKVPTIIVDGNVLSLEKYQGKRSYFRGTFSTSSIESFVQHVNAIGKGAGFVEVKDLKAVVFHDIGDAEDPGLCEFTSELSLTKSPAYESLLDIVDRPLSQRSLVEFIEDHSYCLKTVTKDDTTTSVKEGLQAIRTVNIKVSRDTAHEDKDFGASRSSLESIEASSKKELPQGFYFVEDMYTGLSPVNLFLRLSIHPDPERPTMKLRIVRHEFAKEEKAKEFALNLETNISPTIAFTLGQFNPGN